MYDLQPDILVVLLSVAGSIYPFCSAEPLTCNAIYRQVSAKYITLQSVFCAVF